MTVTNNEFGQSNIWAKEPQMKLQEVTVTHNERAEMLNGRLAMLGVIAALGSYAVTGQMIPGIWWWLHQSFWWLQLHSSYCSGSRLKNLAIHIENNPHGRLTPAIFMECLKRGTLSKTNKCKSQKNNSKNWLRSLKILSNMLAINTHCRAN